MSAVTYFPIAILLVLVTCSHHQGAIVCNCRDAGTECRGPPVPCNSGCQPGWDGPFCQKENIALNQSTRQSGIYVDNTQCQPQVDRFCGPRGPELAVDGNTDTDYWHGSCAVTDTSNRSAWWQVTFEKNHTITGIMIYQRKQLQKMLLPSYIEVDVGGRLCYNVTGSEVAHVTLNIACNQVLQGSQVTLRTTSASPSTIASLTLCEVEIFECSDFWFGDQCAHRCHCLNAREVCNKVTGHCTSGCAMLWSGIACQQHDFAVHLPAYQAGTWSDPLDAFLPCMHTVKDGLQVSLSTETGTRMSLTRRVHRQDLTAASPRGVSTSILYIMCTESVFTSLPQILVDGKLCYSSNTSLPVIANITCTQPILGVFLSLNLPQKLLPNGTAMNRVLQLCEVELYECDDFLFGQSCDGVCHCRNSSEVCDKMTGQCKQSGCGPGWTGANCQTVCPPSTYGINCSSTCGACATPGCGPVTGNCHGSCLAKFAGPNCADCVSGSYGKTCNQKCPYCQGSCDRDTGSCTWCPPHWAGDRCDECHDGWFGAKCQHECGTCFNDTQCNRTTGLCPIGCDPGWQGQFCNQECPDGTYGKDCGLKCGHCNNAAACDKLLGFCLGECQEGWTGNRCNVSCSKGRYGDKCEFVCGHCLHGLQCNRSTGGCPSGCDPGWKTAFCNQECPDNFYGLGCGLKCGQCADGGPCNRVTGNCMGECLRGWSGFRCDAPCPNKTYGVGCQSECGNCLHGVLCNVTTGQCPAGCDLGWQGVHCDQECLDGYYGLGCRSTCGHCDDIAPCHRVTGNCRGECIPGWGGQRCDEVVSTSSRPVTTSTTGTSQSSTLNTSKKTTHNTSNTTEATRYTQQNLSKGAVVGIILGCLAFGALSVLCIAFARSDHRRRWLFLKVKGDTPLVVPSSTKHGSHTEMEDLE